MILDLNHNKAATIRSSAKQIFDDNEHKQNQKKQNKTESMR